MARKFQSVSELIDADEHDGLSEVELDDELLILLIDRIVKPEGKDTIPKPVMVFFASRYMEAEVANGGFAQAAYNIPEWFESAYWAYEELGLPRAAELIKRASAFMEEENRQSFFTAKKIGSLFKQFSESELDKLDSNLDEVGWWATEQRVRLVRANRDAFRKLA